MWADAVRSHLIALLKMDARVWISLSCVCVGLFAAGCGSGEEDATLSGSIARQADSACATVNKRASSELLEVYDLRALKVAASEEEALHLEETVLVPVLITTAESLAGELEKLSVAAADESQIESVVAAYDAWIEEAKASPAKIASTSDVFNGARRLAKEHGLAQCAKSPYGVE